MRRNQTLAKSHTALPPTTKSPNPPPLHGRRPIHIAAAVKSTSTRSSCCYDDDEDDDNNNDDDYDDSHVVTARVTEVADLGVSRPLGGKFNGGGCLYFADGILGLAENPLHLSKTRRQIDHVVGET